jgi:23S rRNA A1618 N6-methylase RlmF
VKCMTKVVKKTAFTPAKGRRVSKPLHAGNPYQGPIDLHALKLQYPETLGSFISYSESKSSASFDWKNAEAVRVLTETMLLRDFNLAVKLHPARLCPTLPNRMNYLCWLNDLLEHTSQPHVLDIGSGANAIYPVLGHAQFGWQFTGTDIDEDSIAWASHYVISGGGGGGRSNSAIKLIKTNESVAAQKIFADIDNTTEHSGSDDEKYRLVTRFEKYASGAMDDLVRDRGPIRQAFAVMGDEYSSTLHKREASYLSKRASASKDTTILSAVMTNPPFYDLEEPIVTNNHSVCTGTEGEMRTLGGEQSFLAAMVVDSLILTTAVRWYTCMVGKKSSLGALRRLLQRCGVLERHTHSTLFRQGKTMRWGLAWSFHTDEPTPSALMPRAGGDPAWLTCDRRLDTTVTMSTQDILASQLLEEKEALVNEDSSSLTKLILSRIKAATEYLKMMTTKKTPLDVLCTHSASPAADTISVIEAKKEASLLFTIRVQMQAVSLESCDLKMTLEYAGGDDGALAAPFSPDGVMLEFSHGLTRTNRWWRRALERSYRK